MNKYELVCHQCGHRTDSFKTWFEADQQCPKCGCQRADIHYNADYSQLRQLFNGTPENFYHYFDFLPISSRQNIVSFGEGAIPIEEWTFLNDYARKEYGVECRAMVYRNDLNGGTGTFKDIAASLGASVMKENGVNAYCVASTGNTATAFARYLSKAGIPFTVFVPNDATPDSVEAIRQYGQTVVVSEGGYGQAKKEAADFHRDNHVLISTGNIDPIRVEAKRTMVFEYLRQLGQMPDVYVQAVAGGTGPIALDKGVRELQQHLGNVKYPRMILAQQDTCDPMVQAWEKAAANNFPEGYEKDYPSVTPHTRISILSAGTPGMYPIVAPLVRQSGGSFVRVKESELVSQAQWIKRERNVLLGPASMVCFAGFLEALKQGLIRNGDTVLLNTGEGASRQQWFVKEVEA
ncbi:MAG: pyridoxal-phosphate dependent enzyme [Paludibacteraceae bacterium]|nr:pyridoxal-phosphate dependent enzyme [Paludibacteraceae bacterium]